jgi:PTS system glucose-specific IIA component
MSVFGKISSLFAKAGDAAEVGVSFQAPLVGRFVPLSEVPDEVFSGKVLGDGFAIDPTEGIVVAPFDAEVSQVFRTGHALGLLGPGGLEVLIHVGIDTVKMAGEGFHPKVKAGQKVRAGELLLEFDLEAVRARAKSTITPVVVTNMDHVAGLEPLATGKLVRGQVVLRVSKKI